MWIRALILAINKTQHQLILVLFFAQILCIIVVEIRVRQELVKAEAIFRVMLKAAVEEIKTLKSHHDALWEEVISLRNVVFQFLLIPACEGWMPSQHLVEYSAKGPDIDLAAVGLTFKNLRRHINRRAAHRPRHVINLLHFLREPKIGNDHIDLTNKLRSLLEIVPIFLVVVSLSESHLLVSIFEV